MRRTIQLLILLIFSAKLHSQDCDKHITVDEDKTTHSRRFSGHDFITIVSNGDTTLKLLALLINDQKTLILSLNTVKKIKCIDPTDEIHFFFDDNTKYTSTGNQDFNCQGALFIYFGVLQGNDALLKLLVTKKVKAIRLSCRAGILDVDLSVENSNELKEEIGCLGSLTRK